MTVAGGTSCYALGKAPYTGAGLSWSGAELDAALNGPVADIVFDETGKADIATLLSGLAETQFEIDGVARILAAPENIEDWRVGEAIAESYLTDHRNATFPWPDGRDERKSGSSLPGADLVGFCTDGDEEDEDCFAFGEVKTSRENKRPPQAMYGRTGLKQQLEDLCDNVGIRDDLVKYLGHRAGKASWVHRYRAASKRYLANTSDIRVFGVLVRDVTPHEDDLRVRVTTLPDKCSSGTVVELFAIYLPGGSIAQLNAKVHASKKGDGK